ncbi:transcriptional regulator, Sir2 family protein [Nostoc sp. NIES-3756]|jgi:NAD-dependent deacetylase|uniref:SIR2 family NAD-dependent protein deacylase n=1 Tax=Nostoc sp. NIES-3756 TaxID=1751286 RepID=UPI00071FECEC|nr:Sir2 family NAD-dependent protein deacetylase [Nostoc sp. NIES-3756]BAT51345.1 transcriptional regulator, Sir2 family protein [Nostoc sp. NIES-3756]
MQSLDFSAYRNIVVLTGAGVSAASGIQPFRGQGGLWKDINPFVVADVSVLETNPLSIWQLFGKLRTQLETAQPNAAHLTLAKLEAQLSASQKFTLITQNIDGLHQRAGSLNVIELHGNVNYTRCSNHTCSLTSYLDKYSHQELLPICQLCNSPLRLDIVLFGEQIPVKQEWLVKQSLRDCDLFIAIGTSGTVWPAANFVRSAHYVGARTIFINLEPMKPQNPYFQEEYLGLAEELLPLLFNYEY